MNEKIHYISNNIIEVGNDLKQKPRKIKSDFINIYIETFFKKKIKFCSAFDDEGSKNFLNSKKAALEQIILEDNENKKNNSSIKDYDTKNETEKRKKHSIYRYPMSNKSNNKILKEKSVNNIVIISNDKLRNKSHDVKNNINSKHVIQKLIENELNAHKEVNQNYNFQEMKMFKDKEIKKIKPIKKNKKCYKKENESILFTFVDGENGIDSSLLIMILQIQENY